MSDEFDPDKFDPDKFDTGEFDPGVKNATEAASSVEAMRLVHSADLSPDGEWVTWTISHIVGDEELFELWLGPADASSARRVEDAEQGRSPCWSPDGTAVAFLSSAAGRTAISLLDPVTLACSLLLNGEAQRIGGGLAWSADSTRIAFSAATSTRDPGEPYRVTRMVGWLDGLGLVDDSTTDIHVVDVRTGAVEQLTHDAWVNRSPSWSPDGQHIFYVAGWGPDNWKSVAVVRSVQSDQSSGHGEPLDVLVGSDFLGVAALAEGVVASTLGPQPDALGRLLVHRPGVEVEDRSGVFDISGDVIADVAIPFADPDPRLLVWDSDALVRVQVGDRLEVHRIALSGAPDQEVVLAGPGCYYPLAVSSGHLLYAEGSLTRAPDLWIRELETGKDTRITQTETHNAVVLAPIEAVQFWVTAGAGPPVDCKFLRPARSVDPLPTVLLIHGGPNAGFGEAFFADAQVLCEAGFGVLLVNPRGSRGYGVEFADAITGDWGNLDMADLIAAVDEAVARGLADPDRLGVAGLSYGGYMSSWLIGHTSRFRAAVIENPVTNLVSMYGTSDVGLRFLPETIGGTPSTNLEGYLRMSPLTYADQCRTPALIVLGEADHRCPNEQGRQFYSALRRAGCEAEMLMLPGESHAGSVAGAVISRRAQNEALVEWMTRHVT